MRVCIVVILFAISFCGHSQTCEEREGKLLELNGSLSAGFAYNTYAVIGALSDRRIKINYSWSRNQAARII